MGRFKYVFVHGLSGWGSYDDAYRRIPYWGMRGGDLMSFLREKGFDCYAASVSPAGSAWDRACELYAQITGTRVDYGEAHSLKYRHERYGRDYSEHPLIPARDEHSQLVLLGHSFGGTTVRLFSELLAHGDAGERLASSPGNLSPLFIGGMENRIHSLVTLATPMNGTTAYDLFTDADFDPESVKTPWWSHGLAKMMSMGTKPRMDGRDERDYANYDMQIYHAHELNRLISTLPHVYYFSVPCSKTGNQPDGTYKPEKGMEPLFVMRSSQIGAYAGKTKGGIVIDKNWRENDGLVNTISAMAPAGAPSRPLDKEQIEPGVWNVYPTVKEDHMWPQGGLMHRHDIRSFYLELLTMIDAL